jgi:hypothetical protein
VWARAFAVTLGLVEEAKASLVAAVPASGRVRGIPLAEALAGFELGLVDASTSMDGWRTEELLAEWLACGDGLRDAKVRAERLRLHRSPQAYEELVAELDDLMGPLETFERAARAVRALRRGDR